jgi:DNA-binding NarL/FixJ family response regulator
VRSGHPATGSYGVNVSIRVLLVDDQALLRHGFRMILDQETDIEVVGEAGNGEEAIILAQRTHPDVVLMDIRMSVVDGVEATRQIILGDPAVRVLILTTFDLDEYAFGALRAGASGFLLKDVHPPELTAGIRTVAAGDAIVSPRITRRLLDECAHLLACPAPDGVSGDDAAVAGLTEREREVLVAVADGLSNAEIGRRLFVSEATVKSHVGRILGKLGLRDRVQAVVYAFQTGIVRPERRS